jgi:ferredoxin/NAD-dependent dihydropyrimidine dehydrogenase PreA subunit
MSINITIDGQPVTVPEGSTILEAARQLGLNIPTLCFLAGVKENRPSCMACVVKVGNDSRLVPSCATKVTAGMAVASETTEVKAARKAALELLFSDHLGDCISVCQRACPAHLQIPETIRLVAAGKMDEAIATVKENIVFPGVLGRICRAPCEQGCRRRQYDGAVAIQLIEREVADLAGKNYVPACAPPTGKRVAIVGAGATGLSAAFFLLKAGHKVVVFDQQPRPGGQMRGKVPDEVLEGDIETICRMANTPHPNPLPQGARGLSAESPLPSGGEDQGEGGRFGFRPNTQLERDVQLAELRAQFDAVILAVGPMAKTNPAALGVEATERMIRVSPANFATNVAGVFAGGTCIRSGWDPARSVGDGKVLAESVDAFLAGREYRLVIKEFTSTIPKLTNEEYQQLAKGANSALSMRDLINEAEQAAGRCCHCDCRAANDCRLRIFAEAYDVNPRAFGGEHRRVFAVIRQPGGVIFEPGKCISCGICVEIAAQAKEPLGLTFIGRGFDVQVAVPLHGTLAEGLQKVGAECVKHCPTGALAFEHDS